MFGPANALYDTRVAISGHVHGTKLPNCGPGRMFAGSLIRTFRRGAKEVGCQVGRRKSAVKQIKPLGDCPSPNVGRTSSLVREKGTVD